MANSQAVEAGARALFEASPHEFDLPYVWDGSGVLLDDEVKDAYRETASKILAATEPIIRKSEQERIREALDSAARASVPQIIWTDKPLEQAWLLGRDETVQHVRTALAFLDSEQVEVDAGKGGFDQLLADALEFASMGGEFDVSKISADLQAALRRGKEG